MVVVASTNFWADVQLGDELTPSMGMSDTAA